MTDPQFATIMYEEATKIINNKVELEKIINDATNNIKTISKETDLAKKSMETLSNRLGVKLEENSEVFETTATNITNFIQQNAQEMKEVAITLQVQDIIREYIKNNDNITKDIVVKKIAEKESPNTDEVNKIFGESTENKKITWIKKDSKEKVFKGTLEEYIAKEKQPHSVKKKKSVPISYKKNAASLLKYIRRGIEYNTTPSNKRSNGGPSI